MRAKPLVIRTSLGDAFDVVALIYETEFRQGAASIDDCIQQPSSLEGKGMRGKAESVM